MINYNAPTFIDKSKLNKKPMATTLKKYECVICGYVYDEEKEDVKFEDLPDDWVCPVCGTDKSDFEEMK